MANVLRRGTAAAAITAVTAALLTAVAVPAHATDEAAPLTNTAHLDFLLDTAAPPAVDGHTTYRLAEEPSITLPWTYADARDGGAFERIGGGPLDEATGDYAQGAYNTDDVARAAVVYLRHWQQTGDEGSREKAYEVLRALAYFQTTTGEDAGNVVLWMQTDGTLNPSAEPVELPDPSDSADSYWLARTLWALGEGYAAFRDADPKFAAFLQERLRLSTGAVEREVLTRYGEYDIADGVEVPGWLIADGADATAESLLGLSAYVVAEPDDEAVRATTAKLADGVASLARTTTDAATTQWPYGAALPWAQSRSMWHAWSSQMATALVASSTALGDPELLQPAIVEGARFAPILLAAGGPQNGWYPSPTERVQIAYGADSRLQVSLALADATGSSAFTDLAALQGAWFFGQNPAREAVYDSATGVTFDGIEADGRINRNSGAESTIHGLLAMLALDAHPDVAARAQTLTTETARKGLAFVQAEDAVSTDGEIVTPESSWTEESSWNGDFLRLDRGRTATFDLGEADGVRILEPVTWNPESGVDPSASSLWRSKSLPLGLLRHEVGAQGVTGASGALLPQRLTLPLPGARASVEVRAIEGVVDLDGILVRPAVSRLETTGGDQRSVLLVNGMGVPVPTPAGFEDRASVVRIYDANGTLVRERALDRSRQVLLPAQGFAVIDG